MVDSWALDRDRRQQSTRVDKGKVNQGTGYSKVDLGKLWKDKVNLLKLI